ncbi:MAG: hypothetical protein H6577_00280 [Lewinellaceae bacterium]|nr:hypothetical protein [Saprospiraceae bacterium]MCB9336546.1 hypothetical protein [Lewinellaceae bacterium]
MLIIQRFFDQIERELGYSPNLDKYFDFLKMLMAKPMPDGVEQRRKVVYKTACYLFCERERDEQRFQQIFDRIFDSERELLEEWLDKAKVEKVEQKNVVNQKPADTPVSTPVKDKKLLEEDDDAPVTKPWEGSTPDKYLNLSIGLSDTENTSQAVEDAESYEDDFFYTNDYHLITFREMIQGWRYFRLQQPLGFSDEIDIPAIIQDITREGMFTELRFKKAFLNREDSLLILADCRGSMTPFHSLVDSLVNTAKKEGGHHKAQVYYFQNYPMHYVYQTPYFTSPKHVNAVLSRVSSEHTYVLIISDAGAAKGVVNENRLNATGVVPKTDKDGNVETNEAGKPIYTLDQGSFLGELLRCTKDVVWLNPMPRNRWRGTSAEIMANTPKVKMYSLYDSNRLGFTFAIKDLLLEG